MGLALSAWLPGCGGGVGTGGTGGYAQGAISGFGSVIVNDVRFDDSTAIVQDADGGGRSRDDLRLGMTVDIESGAIDDSPAGATAIASRIRYASEMVGPLAAVDAASGRVTLLGQVVQIGATTVFDDRLAGGVAALAAGQLVEIYAAFDPASGLYRATRIEPAAGAAVYRLRGVVSQLDAGTRSLRIGAARFSYAGADAVPPTLAEGDFVRLRLQPAAAGSSVWTVLSFGAGRVVPDDGLEARIKGLVGGFVSSQDFSVNGQRIDASGASFPDGVAGLAVGVRVEVEGSVFGGVLRARKVSIESEEQEQERGFELRGRVMMLDTAARRFVVRGVLVGYGGSGVTFKDGSAADLALNREVRVKGRLSADGTLLEASEIEFEG
jgi:hypothetical protein